MTEEAIVPTFNYDLVVNGDGEYLLALHADGRVEHGGEEAAGLAAHRISKMYAERTRERRNIEAAANKLLLAVGSGDLPASFSANLSPELLAASASGRC